MRLDLRFVGLGMICGALPGLGFNHPMITKISIICCVVGVILTMFGIMVEEKAK